MSVNTIFSEVATQSEMDGAMTLTKIGYKTSPYFRLIDEDDLLAKNRNTR